MAGLMRREPHGEATDVFGRFDRLFDEWTRMMPFRPILFPHLREEADDFIRVEEFREDGSLVIRADLPGVDPDRDIEVTAADGMLRIEAERHAEIREEKGYVRQELHYGSLSRSLPLPADVTEADITATYKDGVLEVHVPAPKKGAGAKVAISRA